MNANLRKFFAFEWLVFLIAGLFWAAAMFLPLFLSRAFDNKAALFKNLLILFGPYVLYFVVRVVYLLYRSIVWAYLVSNFFFRSEAERRLADEWIMVVLLLLYWSLLMVFPIHLAGLFSRMSWPLACGILVGPYLLSVIFRYLYKSLIWSIKSQK